MSSEEVLSDEALRQVAKNVRRLLSPACQPSKNATTIYPNGSKQRCNLSSTVVVQMLRRDDSGLHD